MTGLGLVAGLAAGATAMSVESITVDGPVLTTTFDFDRENDAEFFANGPRNLFIDADGNSLLAPLEGFTQTVPSPAGIIPEGAVLQSITFEADAEASVDLFSDTPEFSQNRRIITVSGLPVFGGVQTLGATVSQNGRAGVQGDLGDGILREIGPEIQGERFQGTFGLTTVPVTIFRDSVLVPDGSDTFDFPVPDGTTFVGVDSNLSQLTYGLDELAIRFLPQSQEPEDDLFRSVTGSLTIQPRLTYSFVRNDETPEGPQPIPSPSAFLAGGIGMAGLLLRRRR